MRVSGPPSSDQTYDLGLGFDFSIVGDFFKQAAPVATQLYAQKKQIDMQRKLVEAQTRQQMAVNQAAAQPPVAAYPPPAAYYPGSGYPSSTGRGAGVPGDMPQWVMPAAIAGGVGLLALVLLTRR